MSTSRALTIAFFSAYLIVQITVPTLALFADRPARFGWQMYSALPTVPRAWVLLADRTEQPVDMNRLLAVQRSEIDYAAALTAGLCKATGATAIKVQRSDDSAPEITPCR
jgi:hypothetical protein